MGFEVPILILIIAIPTYFICNWSATKLEIGTERIRRYLVIVSTIVLSPLIYAGLIMIWIFSVSYYATHGFDQEKWNTNLEERYRMSKDIIDSEMLIGKTREEVIDILGAEYSLGANDVLIYELGHVPGLLNIDPDFLEITFRDNMVIHVRQYEG